MTHKYCGKTRKSFSLKVFSSNQLFSNFFSKAIAFTKFLRKKCEREFLEFLHCAVLKLRNFSLTLFWQKFRESNGFTKEIPKKFRSRNIFSVSENFSFSTLHCAFSTSISREIANTHCGKFKIFVSL